MAERKTKKHNIPMNMAIILLFLTLVTTHFTTGLYARFVVTESITEFARVAMMNSGIKEIETEPLNIAPGETVEFGFRVCNGDDEKVSEVSLRYRIYVEQVENNLPLEYKLYNSNERGAQPVTGEGTLRAGGFLSDKYYLKVTWPEDENNPDLAFEVDALKITIVAEQID